MINHLLRLHTLQLRRDRVALLLTFILPLAFFSIFALILGGAGGGGGGMRPVRVLLVDEDGSETSQRFVSFLGQQGGLDLRLAPRAAEDAPPPPPYERSTAEQAIAAGRAPVAVVLPAGFGQHFANFAGSGQAVELIYDVADPMARHVVSGLLQATAMQAAPELLVERGLGMLQQFGGPLTPAQEQAIQLMQSAAAGSSDPSEQVAGGPAGVLGQGLIRVESRDVRLEEPKQGRRSSVAYYAAGISVMFLLFSMSGAAGSLLDEQESGVLERLLAGGLPLPTMLWGKWLFYGLVGVAQIAVMFVWGALAFGLNLGQPHRLAGLVVMTLVTSLSASAFAMMLATVCRTRAQLGGVSTIVVLLMSAVGGSMFPRYIMPPVMDRLALLTFNGWALDGYLKVLWYDDPDSGVLQNLLSLAPQVGVLAALCLVFLFVARQLARRWETV